MQSSELETKINQIRDSIFKSFSRTAGVPNIREYEAKMEEELAQNEQKLSSWKRERAELGAEVERLHNSLTEINTKLDLSLQKKAVPCPASCFTFMLVCAIFHLPSHNAITP